MNKAKLVWTFNGINGKKTAEHHLIHLKEFSQIESIPLISSGIDEISSFSCETFIIVEMIWVEKLRYKLKPNKGYALN